MSNEKSIETIKTSFPADLIIEWDRMYRAAQMIRNGTGKIKRVWENGKYVLRTVAIK